MIRKDPKPTKHERKSRLTKDQAVLLRETSTRKQALAYQWASKINRRNQEKIAANPRIHNELSVPLEFNRSRDGTQSSKRRLHFESESASAESFTGEQNLKLPLESGTSISIVDWKYFCKICRGEHIVDSEFDFTTKDLNPVDIINLMHLLDPKSATDDPLLARVRSECRVADLTLEKEESEPATSSDGCQELAFIYRDYEGRLFRPSYVKKFILTYWNLALDIRARTFNWLEATKLLRVYLETPECLKHDSEFPKKPFLLDPEGTCPILEFPPSPSDSGIMRRIPDQQELAAEVISLELNYNDLKQRWLNEVLSYLDLRRRKLSPALVERITLDMYKLWDPGIDSHSRDDCWEFSESESEEEYDQPPYPTKNIGYDSPPLNHTMTQSQTAVGFPESLSFNDAQTGLLNSPHHTSDSETESEDSDDGSKFADYFLPGVDPKSLENPESALKIRNDLPTPRWNKYRLAPGDLQMWLNQVEELIDEKRLEDTPLGLNNVLVPLPLFAPGYIHVSPRVASEEIRKYIDTVAKSPNLLLTNMAKSILNFFKSAHCLKLFENFSLSSPENRIPQIIAYKTFFKETNTIPFHAALTSRNGIQQVQPLCAHWMRLSPEEQTEFIVEASKTSVQEYDDFFDAHPELDQEILKMQLEKRDEMDAEELSDILVPSGLQIFLGNVDGDKNQPTTEREDKTRFLCRQYSENLSESERRKYEAAAEDLMWETNLLASRSQLQINAAGRLNRLTELKNAEWRRQSINALLTANPPPTSYFFVDSNTVNKNYMLRPPANSEEIFKRLLSTVSLKLREQIYEEAKQVEKARKRGAYKQKGSQVIDTDLPDILHDANDELESNLCPSEISSAIEIEEFEADPQDLSDEYLSDTAKEQRKKKERFLNWLDKNPVSPGPTSTVFSNPGPPIRNLDGKSKKESVGASVLLGIANIAAEFEAQEREAAEHIAKYERNRRLMFGEEDFEWPDVPEEKVEKLTQIVEEKSKSDDFLIANQPSSFRRICRKLPFTPKRCNINKLCIPDGLKMEDFGGSNYHVKLRMRFKATLVAPNEEELEAFVEGGLSPTNQATNGTVDPLASIIDVPRVH